MQGNNQRHGCACAHCPPNPLDATPLLNCQPLEDTHTSSVAAASYIRLYASKRFARRLASAMKRSPALCTAHMASQRRMRRCLGCERQAVGWAAVGSIVPLLLSLTLPFPRQYCTWMVPRGQRTSGSLGEARSLPVVSGWSDSRRASSSPQASFLQASRHASRQCTRRL
jgi:hypothetical protein